MSCSRISTALCFVIWAACIISCNGSKTKEAQQAEVTQAAAEGWEERLAKLQADAIDKFPDPPIAAGAGEKEMRIATAQVATKRAKWVADWLDPSPKSMLNLADLHVGDIGKADATVRVVAVTDYSLVVSYGGSRFVVAGVETDKHATGHLVRLNGFYSAESTGDYGNDRLVKLYEWKPDPKATWRHEQALQLWREAEKKEVDAREKPAAPNKKGKIDTPH